MPKCQVSKKVRVYGLFVAWGVLLPFLASCAHQAVQFPPPPEDKTASQDYFIGPEDVVEVMVWKNPDLSRVVNVRPDGKISLPLIGDIKAAGRTAVQLTEAITAELMTYYKEPPQVSVIVQQINSYAVYILGEVHSPGRYVVKTGTTFLQAITLAGGFTDFAATSRILVRRRDHQENSEMAMGLKYRDILAGTQSNILLKSGDTIIVP